MPIARLERELSKMEASAEELQKLSRTMPGNQEEILLVVKNLRLSIKFLRAAIHRETARTVRRGRK